MNIHHEDTSARGKIMNVIHKGQVHMRPRWHFILYSAFAVVGTVIVFLTVLYAASLAVFFLRESGAFFAPSFGPRGWFVLLRNLPWLLIILILVFIALLQILVSRYSFVYRKPLVVSLIGIVALIFVGGFAIAQTSFHHRLFQGARHGHLPSPMGMLYGSGLRPHRDGEMYHGRITRMIPNGFVLADIEGEGTSTIVITPQTRLPYGADFSADDLVVVIGDEVATGTVQAFGVREIGE